MPINKDFEELFHHLNTAGAEYIVVGAYAVIYHTEPRYTKDIDIWINPDPRNAVKVYEALKKFGAPLRDLTPQDLSNPKMVYQVGIEPNRIDILMGIGTLPFKEAWKKRCEDHYGSEKIFVLGLGETIRAKKEAGRPHDERDLEILEQAKKKQDKKSR
ncbi:MAG: hypothetical protein HYT76_01725 [Deltaproteobacteria bacterium]|nr:hypothetical protein [Deltaproteobacteria bacterium]